MTQLITSMKGANFLAMKRGEKKIVDDSMRRDKAVCVWSHAIGCYVKVGQEGEWELVEGRGGSRGRSRNRERHGQAEKEGGDGQKDPPGGEKAHLAVP